MKGILFYLLALLLYVTVNTALYVIADYLMVALELSRHRISSLGQVALVYFALTLVELVVFALLVSLFLLELFYRQFRFRPFYYKLSSIILFTLYAFASWPEAYSYVSTEHSIARAKILICHIIVGILYPVITEYLAKRFRIFQYR